MNAISLFSGMGGDSLGIVNAGLKLVAYSEKDKIFQQTHELNFPESKLIGNGNILKTTDEQLELFCGNCDLIFAGFPCQSFSSAGKRKINDPRNTMFKEFVRATKLIQPTYIIGENVKGLLTKKTESNEKYIDIIVKEFENLGYFVKYKVLKTNLYGIPQKRQRLFIIGSKIEQPMFPIELNTPTNLQSIVKFNMYGAIKITDEDYDLSILPNECVLTDMNNEENENNVHNYLRMVVKDRNVSYNGKSYKHRVSFGKRGSPIHGEIVDIRNPCKTVICTYSRQPRFYVPLKNKNGYFLRCLLPDELKQIQGFPSNYTICGNTNKKIIQIGNAVPPPLIEQVIKALTTP